MYRPSSQPGQQSTSNATETSSGAFVETIEYNRFVEFCDACRRFRYIGLCYGAPGIGKTLSALRYSRAEKILSADRAAADCTDQPPLDTILYTTSVINTPSRVDSAIRLAREDLVATATRTLHHEAVAALHEIRLHEEAKRQQICNGTIFAIADQPPPDPVYLSTVQNFEARRRAFRDPTTLILVDEADRLQMNSLEQMRSIFDEGTAGMVLIGMPGIEKRVARFPQFYSRIGFVHEFRALQSTEMTELLERQWTPAGVTLPDAPFSPEVVARLIRMTGGNFRLLTRLLTQIERVLDLNDLAVVSTEVVEAARDSLVIGQS
jgi:DNA transposition AAA+ family ATPase